MSGAAKSMHAAADWADRIFEERGIKLTLGGEPTFVPEHPEGAEWSYSAVGPTKLSYARRMADELLKGRMSGGVVFFSPGKQYPGEVNPRWALRMVARRDGRSLFPAVPGNRRAEEAHCIVFLRELLDRLDVRGDWIRFADPKASPAHVWVLPLDHDGTGWVTVDWKLKPDQRSLIAAEGPAGLRLPLYLIPVEVPRRALVVELKEGRLCIFFPPLLQPAFAKLAKFVGESLVAAKINLYELQGYVPADDEKVWVTLGLAADPGVLEINLPPCENWQEYDAWMHELTACAERVGLRSWKQVQGEFADGTGGGNHLLWGGPSIEENPFFSRPGWLTAIIRMFQNHPALAYMFTGCYVGASSQAPRPDESAKEIFDLEMAYSFLESLGEGDHRALINETLRHLHTDVTGNAHRSEISFDKFWNPGWPGGMLGLIEFRAVESLPRAEWMSAVALLWRCVAAYACVNPERKPLRKFEGALHDRYFLPTCMWNDLEDLLAELAEAGCPLSGDVFRKIWAWRFPMVLEHDEAGAQLEVRRAHESWPLLCETPIEGGTTSRFVDTSMHRVEVRVNDDFAARYELLVQGRKLPVTPVGADCHLAGVRYRRSCLYPCLHPGIPVHLPLEFTIVEPGASQPVATFRLPPNSVQFGRVENAAVLSRAGTCRPIFEGALTHDLRLE